MSTYSEIIDAFITDNNLDEEIKDSLIDLVNKCFTGVVTTMSKEWLGSSISNKSEKSVKTSKSPKLENPADATSIDDLELCTSVILNAFCKENGLRVGGGPVSLSEPPA
jgi:hypothetical protein